MPNIPGEGVFSLLTWEQIIEVIYVVGGISARQTEHDALSFNVTVDNSIEYWKKMPPSEINNELRTESIPAFVCGDLLHYATGKIIST